MNEEKNKRTIAILKAVLLIAMVLCAIAITATYFFIRMYDMEKADHDSDLSEWVDAERDFLFEMQELRFMLKAYEYHNESTAMIKLRAEYEFLKDRVKALLIKNQELSAQKEEYLKTIAELECAMHNLTRNFPLQMHVGNEVIVANCCIMIRVEFEGISNNTFWYNYSSYDFEAIVETSISIYRQELDSLGFKTLHFEKSEILLHISFNWVNIGQIETARIEADRIIADAEAFAEALKQNHP
jgi:hypothetical protein